MDGEPRIPPVVLAAVTEADDLKAAGVLGRLRLPPVLS